MTAPQIVADIMEQKGISMAELGRQLGVSTQVIFERLRPEHYNISILKLAETLAPLGYSVVIVPDEKMKKLAGSYRVNHKRTK